MRLNNNLEGPLFACLAYAIWGFAPLYFKLIQHLTASEILMHRVLWSIGLLLIILTSFRRWPLLLNILKSRRTMMVLLCSAGLLSINWWLFIYAINTDRILEASLGYYINPLFNVLLGYLVLKEQMSKRQGLAVAIAVGAVALQMLSLGYLPWIPIVLAASFSLYGLVRKQLGIESTLGLSIESLYMLPWAIYYAYNYAQSHSNPLNIELSSSLLLLLCGVVTTLPLLFFNAAAQRLKYATLGFFQYLAPTIMFVIAVTIYSEPLSFARITTFLLVWLAIGLYLFDEFKRRPQSDV